MASTSLDQAGGYRLVMQDDGDLVLRWGAAVLWSTATGGHPGARAVLQHDGDFVVADSGGAVLWSAGTAGSGAVTVVLTLAGELAVAAPAGQVWAAGSDGYRGRIESLASPAGGNQLQMQGDGNFVLYAAGSPLWSSGTAGAAGAVAQLQPDGNLVISAPDAGVLWTSGTTGSGATEVVVTDAGNAELLTAGGVRVWQAIAPPPAAPVASTPRAPAASGGSPGGGSSRSSGPAGSPSEEAPPAAPMPVSNDYGLAGSLISEINAYRQANGLDPLQVSGELNSYAQACSAGMAAVDAPLAHCRSGEIVQYNTYGSPHAWLLAYANSPSHNAIMLIPDIKYIGGGVTLSPGGRYYSAINVSY